MHRTVIPGLCLLALTGCQLPAERVPLRPLPDDAGPIPYAELLTRARVQAMNAQEMYYLNKWQDLEEAAKGLEQTAKHLPKASEIPANQKDTLPVTAGDLGKESANLREAARAKDFKKIEESMNVIHRTVRELRLDK
ncbi:MAG TPA: hypothetical protein VKE94_14030 [Gemmataceae bacterium]|nr:hypothetical protein [Gemmataceae bacterium]